MIPTLRELCLSSLSESTASSAADGSDVSSADSGAAEAVSSTGSVTGREFSAVSVATEDSSGVYAAYPEGDQLMPSLDAWT